MAVVVTLLLLLVTPTSSGNDARRATAPTAPVGTPAAGLVPCSLAACPNTARPLPQAGGDFWYNVTSAQRFSPPPMVGASMAYDALDNYLVLFGGCAAALCPADPQTWSYSGGSWTNLTALSPQPPARSFAGMTYDSHDNEVVLFGGRGAAGSALNDTWSFVGGAWTNLTNRTLAPSARYAAALTYDRSDSYVLLYGGCGALRCPLNDTWRFSAGTWKNLSGVAGVPPPARYGAAVAYDNGDGYALLFGGCGGVCPLGDSWSFSKGKWAQLTVTGSPTPRAFAALSYDAGLNQTYLVGGNASLGPRQETWKFGNARWTNVTALAGPGPSARFGIAAPESSIAWSASGVKKWPYSFFFGGSRGSCLTCTPGPLGDSWVLEPAVSVAASALPTVAEVGQPVTFTAAAVGGSPPYVYLWQFDDGSSAFGASATHGFGWARGFVTSVTLSDTSGAIVNATALVTVVAGPSVSLSVVPSTTDIGLPVSFVGGASGGAGAYTFRWSFGDLSGSSSPTTTHSYAVPGRFPVNLSATDMVQGRGIGFANVSVNPLPDLTAVGSNLTPAVGANVSFTASVSGGTAPFTYRWLFGDNNSSSQPDVVRAYARPGTYLVHASVVDSVGAASWENFTIVVAGPQPHGESTGGSPSLTTWLGWGTVVAGLGVIVVGLVWALHRRRRPPVAPLAAAAVGQGGWDSDEGPDGPGASRAARRSLNRFYRRRS